MSKNAKTITRAASETDDVKPELGDAWFAQADAYVGERLVRRGRPKSANPKQPVSVRLDRDVVAWLKRDGEGWQTRLNNQLRKAAGL